MGKQYRLKIINISTGVLVGDRIRYAGSFMLRLKGLIRCQYLFPGEGLLLYPCSSVHSFGMKISLDVVFLDENLSVLKTVSNMKPGLTARQKGASFCLELRAGSVEEQGIKTGHIFNFQKIYKESGIPSIFFL